MKILRSTFNKVTGEIFEWWCADCKIRRTIAHLQSNEPQPQDESPKHHPLPLDRLLRHLQQEDEGRRSIEDKAKTNVLGITLASAMLAFVPRVAAAVTHNPNWALWAFIVLQVAGIVFLLLGGGLALRTLRIEVIHLWALQDEWSTMTDEARNAKIGWYLENNQLVSRRKANSLSASYSCIRNGVLAFALAAVLALILVAFEA